MSLLAKTLITLGSCSIQLTNPSAFVKPTFDQALADLVTAEFLLGNVIEAAPYNNHPALDAAMAKLQQAAEKAIKGTILVLCPGTSYLVFHPHALLSEKDILPTDRRFRAVLDRITRYHHGQPLRATLEELEKHAPSGVKRAECDPDGNVLSLPLNTEYPFLEKGGQPVAPVAAWSSRFHDVSRFAKAVNTLFRHLKGIPQVSTYLTEHPGKPILS